MQRRQVARVRHAGRAGEDREAAFHPGPPGRAAHSQAPGTPPTPAPGPARARGRNGEDVHGQPLALESPSSSPGQQQPHRPPASRRAAGLAPAGSVTSPNELNSFQPSSPRPMPSHEPAAGQPVQHGHLASQHPRPAPRQRGHHGAEPDLAGRGGYRGHRDPGLGHRHAGSGQHADPQRKRPDPPASSATTARSATRPESASSPNGGMKSPNFTCHHPPFRRLAPAAARPASAAAGRPETPG